MFPYFTDVSYGNIPPLSIPLRKAALFQLFSSI